MWPVGTDGKCVSVGCKSDSGRAAAPEEEEEDKGQNLKNVPAQKNPEGLTFWFSLSLCGGGQMIPGVGQ